MTSYELVDDIITGAHDLITTLADEMEVMFSFSDEWLGSDIGLKIFLSLTTHDACLRALPLILPPERQPSYPEELAKALKPTLLNLLGRQQWKDRGQSVHGATLMSHLHRQMLVANGIDPLAYVNAIEGNKWIHREQSGWEKGDYFLLDEPGISDLPQIHGEHIYNPNTAEMCIKGQFYFGDDQMLYILDKDDHSMLRLKLSLPETIYQSLPGKDLRELFELPGFMDVPLPVVSVDRTRNPDRTETLWIEIADRPVYAAGDLHSPELEQQLDEALERWAENQE